MAFVIVVVVVGLGDGDGDAERDVVVVVVVVWFLWGVVGVVVVEGDWEGVVSKVSEVVVESSSVSGGSGFMSFIVVFSFL